MTRFIFGIGFGLTISQGNLWGVILMTLLLAGLEICDRRLGALSHSNTEGERK